MVIGTTALMENGRVAAVPLRDRSDEETWLVVRGTWQVTDRERAQAHRGPIAMQYRTQGLE
jgi:mannose-6-phosphate isomerase-like protein (cupin superfamily)